MSHLLARATAVALIVAVLHCTGLAQTDATIEWSAYRKLTTEDFRGDVPRQPLQGNVRRGALSFLGIQANWTCTDQRVVGSARAVCVSSPRYDQETKHGTFLFAQGKWESRVKSALSE